MSTGEMVVILFTLGGVIGFGFNIWKIQDARRDLEISALPEADDLAPDSVMIRIRYTQVHVFVNAVSVFIGVALLSRYHVSMVPAPVVDWLESWRGAIFRGGLLVIVYALDWASFREFWGKRRLLRKAQHRER